MLNRSGIILIIFTVLLFLYYSLLSCGVYYAIDDSYIVFRYVDNLLQHGKLTWNIDGEMVDGYTSFLWTIYLAAMRLSDASLSTIQSFSNLFFSISILAIIFYWSYLINGKKTDIKCLLAPTILIINLPFIHWTILGLESIFYALLSTLMLFMFWNSREKGGMFTIPFLCVLVAFTRPEGLFLAFLTLAFFCHRIAIREPAKKFRLITIAISLFLIPIVVHFIWHWLTYGFPFPNTYYAKINPTLISDIRDGLKYFKKFLFYNGGCLLLLLVPYVFTRGKAEVRCKLFFSVFICASVAITIIEGGDCWKKSRFFLNIMPLLAVMPLMILRNQRIHQRNLINTCVAVILCVYFANQCYEIKNYSSPGRCLARIRQYSLAFPITEFQDTSNEKFAGLWIKENFREDTVIAGTDIGRIAYFSELRCIDLMSLNDRAGAHLIESDTSRFGKSNFSFYYERYKPDTVFLGFWLLSKGNLADMDIEKFKHRKGSLIWLIFYSNRFKHILDDPLFKNNYHFVSLKIKSPYKDKDEHYYFKEDNHYKFKGNDFIYLNFFLRNDVDIPLRQDLNINRTSSIVSHHMFAYLKLQSLRARRAWQSHF